MSAVARRVAALDVGVVAAIGVLVLFAAQNLRLMSVVVPIAIVARMLLWRRLTRSQGHALVREAGFLLLCTLIGSFNDWNSVVRHRVYDYTVPCDVCAFSTIPTWMFLYWGMILRLMISLADLPAFSAGGPPEIVRIGRRRLRGQGSRLVLLLVLVVLTRQCIYRFYMDPVWSWLPFLVALVIVLLVLPPDRGGKRLMLLAFVAGPLVEAALIQIGGLHAYHLGVLGGVPIWIVLWWTIAVEVWREVVLFARGRPWQGRAASGRAGHRSQLV